MDQKRHQQHNTTSNPTERILPFRSENERNRSHLLLALTKRMSLENDKQGIKRNERDTRKCIFCIKRNLYDVVKYIEQNKYKSSET